MEENNMNDVYVNRHVIHKNFGKGKIIGSYVNGNRDVVVIKFDCLDTERHIYADFYGMRIFK